MFSAGVVPQMHQALEHKNPDKISGATFLCRPEAAS